MNINGYSDDSTRDSIDSTGDSYDNNGDSIILLVIMMTLLVTNDFL